MHSNSYTVCFTQPLTHRTFLLHGRLPRNVPSGCVVSSETRYIMLKQRQFDDLRQWRSLTIVKNILKIVGMKLYFVFEHAKCSLSCSSAVCCYSTFFYQFLAQVYSLHASFETIMQKYFAIISISTEILQTTCQMKYFTRWTKRINFSKVVCIRKLAFFKRTCSSLLQDKRHLKTFNTNQMTGFTCFHQKY